MAKGKKTLIDRNIEKFISNNFGKKEINDNDSFKFELFVNSMHVWQCSSQTYSSNNQIGKDISLGKAQGSDAFFISINDFEKIFTLKDNLETVIKTVTEEAKEVTFHFIQTKKSENADWGNFLKFIEIPLNIWKGLEFSITDKINKDIQNLIDEIIDSNNQTLKNISHKIDISFYTNKNDSDIEKLRINWKLGIDQKISEFSEWLNKKEISIKLQGSSYVNDIYEKLGSNEYEMSIKKNQVREIDENKYLIGYLTANELLDGISSIVNGERSLYLDVFKNNIRLYLGDTGVNREIKKTLVEEPEFFHFYNNGLTITTKKISGDNSKNYTISPVNIVNGCQTANSIFNVFKSDSKNIEKVKIPVRIIVAKDQEFENITIRTNTQNGLEAKDLISIKNIQKDIEEDFLKTKFLGKKFIYKRQKSDSVNSVEADFIVHIDDILRASFSTIMLIPNKVSGYYDVTTKKYLDLIFDERFSKIYTILTVILKLVKFEIDESDFNRLSYHICYLIYRFVNKNQDINSIEEYFRDGKNFENDEELTIQNKLIECIYSNLYSVIKSEITFKNTLEYITGVIKEKYPELLDISDKKKERILYSPVHRTKGIKKNPIFDNFDEHFSRKFTDFIQK